MNRVEIDPVWLMHVQKPARYVGGEWNSVMKNHADVDVKVALVFPDVYEVGMSHLGLKIIYSVINSRKDARLNESIHHGLIWKNDERKKYTSLCTGIQSAD